MTRVRPLMVAITLLTLLGGADALRAAQNATPPGPQAAVPTGSSAPTQAATDRANKILADVRQALGGDKLAAVKTVSATGRTRRIRGNNLVPIEFEMDIARPDKYMRRDEVPAEESDPTSIGFNGDDLIQIPAPIFAPPPGRAGTPPLSPEQLEAQRQTQIKTAVIAAKQDFARLALGMFADTPGYPMTFAFFARAEGPQGTADVLDGRAPDGFALRFLATSDTHMPVMVSWQAPPTAVIVLAPGAPPPPSVAPGAVVVTGPAAPAHNASKDDQAAYTKAVQALRAKTQAIPVENRVYFADYRTTDGVMFPYRLRRAIGTDTSEETTFDRFRLNQPIDPKKFQPAK